MKNNQEKQGSWGGPRPNSGRPKGSSHKPKLTDQMTDEEIRDLVIEYKLKAKEDNKVLLHLIDHIFGKARQNVGLDGGEDGKSIIIELSKEIAEKNDINSGTSEDSN